MKIFATGEKKLANDRSSKIYIYGAILFAVSFLVYFIFTRLSPIPEPKTDALTYIMLAKSIAAGTGFARMPPTPAVVRPPLFSHAVGFWFLITGNTSTSSSLIFEILLQSLGIWAAFLLFSRIFSLKTAFWGGLFIAFNPFLLTELVWLMQEPMLLLVTTSAACMTIIWFKDQTYSKAALVGFFWGLATLGKIVTLHAPVIFWMIWLLQKLFSKLSWNLSWKKIAVISGVFILTIAPWTVRNYVQFNRFIIINAGGGEETLALTGFFCSEDVFGPTAGKDYVENLLSQDLPPKVLTAKIFKYAWKHPGETLLKMAHNVFSFTSVSREWFGHVAGLSMRWYIWIIPAILLNLPLYIGLFAGMLYDRRVEIIFLSLFYLTYWAGHAVIGHTPRFAVPVYPILVALGLNGWSWLLLLRKKNNR